jgi:hypothetical protein
MSPFLFCTFFFEEKKTEFELGLELELALQAKFKLGCE